MVGTMQAWYLHLALCRALPLLLLTSVPLLRRDEPRAHLDQGDG